MRCSSRIPWTWQNMVWVLRKRGNCFISVTTTTFSGKFVTKLDLLQLFYTKYFYEKVYQCRMLISRFCIEIRTRDFYHLRVFRKYWIQELILMSRHLWHYILFNLPLLTGDSTSRTHVFERQFYVENMAILCRYILLSSCCLLMVTSTYFRPWQCVPWVYF